MKKATNRHLESDLIMITRAGVLCARINFVFLRNASAFYTKGMYEISVEEVSGNTAHLYRKPPPVY